MNSAIALLKKIYKLTYKTLFNKIDIVVENEARNCKSLLDVGCGSNSLVKTFSSEVYCVGVDAFEPSLEESRKKEIHKEYYKMNILEIGEVFNKKSFECVIAIDVIEHLKKNEGFKLLDAMEKVASKKVILYTPNGFLPQGDRFNNPWQVHLSGWTVEDFESRGYKVMGINGWKPFRGQYAKIKYRPRFLFSFISDLSQIFTKNNPHHAFQLVAIKVIND